jgi:hexosaminidase
VNYRIPDLTGFTEENVFNKPVALKVNKPLPSLVIRYTNDGKLPTTNSPVLSNPFMVSSASKLKIAAFGPTGNRGDIYTLNYKQQDYFKAQTVSNLNAGLQLHFFGNKIKSVADLPLKSDTTVTVSNFIIAEGLAKEGAAFSVRLSGYIDVPETGIYSFYLTADDGANLYVDGEKVIDNDGWHYPIQKSGQVALEKGPHAITLPFVEAGGGYTLKLEYSLNGSELKKVPDTWLKRK